MGPVAVCVYLLVQRPQFLFARAGINDGELIAVKAVHGCLGGQKLLNALRKLAQHGVTKDVAV